MNKKWYRFKGKYFNLEYPITTNYLTITNIEEKILEKLDKKIINIKYILISNCFDFDSFEQKITVFIEVEKEISIEESSFFDFQINEFVFEGFYEVITNKNQTIKKIKKNNENAIEYFS